MLEWIIRTGYVCGFCGLGLGSVTAAVFLVLMLLDAACDKTAHTLPMEPFLGLPPPKTRLDEYAKAVKASERLWNFFMRFLLPMALATFFLLLAGGLMLCLPLLYKAFLHEIAPGNI